MPSRLWSNTVLIVSGLVFAACAAKAPDLPPDYGSVNATETLSLSDFSAQDAALNCASISDEMDSIAAQVDVHEANIKSLRQRNQVAGYAAAIFLPALAATDNSTEDKEAITSMNERRDVLLSLTRLKSC